ncbi:MAG: RraA family protein [Pseudomonadota bacterium]
MIESPPLLTIKTRERRPTRAQIETLKDYPTPMLADALGGQGALAPEVKPVSTKLPQRAAGAALTVDCGPRDILALGCALHELEAGEVLVVAAGGWRDSAAFGDRVCGMARNGGAAAIVSDGTARDLSGIEAAGLPVWCTGLAPNSPYANGPGSIGLPVRLGSVQVETGDVIVADEDGVTVIPFDRLDEIAEKIKVTFELETELDKKVAEGLAKADSLAEFLASDQVRRI